MPESYTPRGFAMYADFPYQTYTNTPEDVRYTVQESSAASERKVWVGVDEERAHLSEEQARILRDALTEFLGEPHATAGASILDYPQVSRVEIIDATGRDVVRYYDRRGASIHLQDDWRTIKIFTAGEKR